MRTDPPIFLLLGDGSAQLLCAFANPDHDLELIGADHVCRRCGAHFMRDGAAREGVIIQQFKFGTLQS